MLTTPTIRSILNSVWVKATDPAGAHPDEHHPEGHAPHHARDAAAPFQHGGPAEDHHPEPTWSHHGGEPTGTHHAEPTWAEEQHASWTKGEAHKPTKTGSGWGFPW